MVINIHIFIPGEVLYFGYNALIVSYAIFVKILIIQRKIDGQILKFPRQVKILKNEKALGFSVESILR